MNRSTLFRGIEKLTRIFSEQVPTTHLHQAHSGCRGADWFGRFAGTRESLHIHSLRIPVPEICGDFLDAQRLEAQSFLGIAFIVRGLRCGRIGSESHGNVDVFENLTRSDAENSVAGFDEVVTFASAMLSAEVIGEAEAGIELLGLNQETRAVSLPLI